MDVLSKGKFKHPQLQPLFILIDVDRSNTIEFEEFRNYFIKIVGHSESTYSRRPNSRLSVSRYRNRDHIEVNHKRDSSHKNPWRNDFGPD